MSDDDADFIIVMDEDAAAIAELEACISDFTDYLDDDPTVPRLVALVERLKDSYFERNGIRL